MTCNCGSERIASLDAKCSDLCVFSFGEEETDGYVPKNVGIGGGDYVAFDYCLDCGQIQQFEIVSEQTIDKVFGRKRKGKGQP